MFSRQRSVRIVKAVSDSFTNPCSAAHMTASRYQSFSRSVNGELPSGSGFPALFHRATAHLPSGYTVIRAEYTISVSLHEIPVICVDDKIIRPVPFNIRKRLRLRICNIGNIIISSPLSRIPVFFAVSRNICILIIVPALLCRNPKRMKR